MAGGGDRGMSRRAERIEMKKRRTVDAYLYETDIVGLTDDTVRYSHILVLIPSFFQEIFPILSSRTVVSSHAL